MTSQTAIGANAVLGRRGVSALGRAAVEPPRPAPDAWQAEERKRRPVAAELRRVYGVALLNLAAVTLLLLPGLIVATYMSSRIGEPVDPAQLLDWVRRQRGVWKTEVLLGVPVTVLFPSVLTVVLSSAPGDAGVEAHTPRSEAFLEVVRNVLYHGLLLGAGFALLAAIPEPRGFDVPMALLAIAIAVGCATLSGTLRMGGTEKDLLVAKAKARLLAAQRSQEPLLDHLRTHASWSASLLSPGWGSASKVVLLGVALLGGPPAFALGAWSLLEEGPTSLSTWLAGLLVLGVYSGAQALFIVFFGSRRRLATTRGEAASSLGFLMVPVGILVLQVLVFALVATTPTGRSATGVFAGVLVASDLLALLLSRTAFATVLDCRRLGALRLNAASQVEYLTEDLRMSRRPRRRIRSAPSPQRRTRILQSVRPRT